MRRQLGYEFTSADDLEEVDIGPGDKPRPTFISKKLDPSLREPMIALLREYQDYFAWDYTEMPGLDRSIVEHRLPLKKGFRPFQQRARQMKAEVLEEVKKEVQKMLDAGLHERGIEIGLKCQEAIKAMKPPTTKKELQKLIGKINFVR